MTIIFHGTADTVTPLTGAKEFQRKMLAAGNHCELITHEGGKHGYLMFDESLYQETLSKIGTFLSDQGFLDTDASQRSAD